jgi:hypothetical protein
MIGYEDAAIRIPFLVNPYLPVPLCSGVHGSWFPQHVMATFLHFEVEPFLA